MLAWPIDLTIHELLRELTVSNTKTMKQKYFTNSEDSPLKTKVKNEQPTRTSIKGKGGRSQHFIFHLHDFTTEQGIISHLNRKDTMKLNLATEEKQLNTTIHSPSCKLHRNSDRYKIEKKVFVQR
jgi:hypothetical protein